MEPSEPHSGSATGLLRLVLATSEAAEAICNVGHENITYTYWHIISCSYVVSLHNYRVYRLM